MSPEDEVTVALAQVVGQLHAYLDVRPGSEATDDDVKALEDAAWRLQQVSADGRTRLRALLGEQHAQGLGIDAD